LPSKLDKLNFVADCEKYATEQLGESEQSSTESYLAKTELYGEFAMNNRTRFVNEMLKPMLLVYGLMFLMLVLKVAAALVAEGFDLVSGGTDNHLMLLDLRNMNITGKELEHRLDEVRITVNKNAIPNDPQSPFITSGIRIGTPAVTTRGLNTEDMKTIAHLIKLVATDFENSADYCRAEVDKICDKYPLYN
jgi:glycine hydroxymethyltransferase